MRVRTIDWKAVQDRLAIAAAAVSAGRENPERVRCVLELRARLAAVPPVNEQRVQLEEVLGFRVGSDDYAVETRYVLEVCRLRDLTALPCVPRHIVGVMSLHGRIIAVVDLRSLFDLPARGLTELNQVIVLRDGDGELGLLADSIEGVRSMMTSNLQDVLPTLTGIRARFLLGIGGQGLAVLDGARLLSDEALKVREYVTR